MQNAIKQTDEAVEVAAAADEPKTAGKPTMLAAPGCFLTIDGDLAVQLNKRVVIFSDGKYFPHELGEPTIGPATPSVRVYKEPIPKRFDEVCIGEAFWLGGVYIKVTNKKCVVGGRIVDNKIYPFVVRVFGKLEY